MLSDRQKKKKIKILETLGYKGFDLTHFAESDKKTADLAFAVVRYIGNPVNHSSRLLTSLTIQFLSSKKK